MQKYLDWATFVKLDNAVTLDFLSSLVAALSEQNQFPKRELLQLKQALAARSVEWSNDEKSIISCLNEEHTDTIIALKTRFGSDGFSLNHFRFTLRPLMAELISRITVWADVVLKKSELVFNRPFYVRSRHGVERRELFSQVLYSYAQLLFNSVSDIRNSINEISTLRPSCVLDTTGDYEKIDNLVAIQIGFAGIDEMASFSRAESRALSRLSLTLTELSIGVTRLNQQLIENCVPSEDLLSTFAYCERLAAEVQRFSGLNFPESTSTTVWEMRRQAICFSLYNVGQIIDSLANASNSSISPQDSKDWRDNLSEDLENRISTELFSSGHRLNDSLGAAKKLLAYCHRYDTEPSLLIPAELKKIDPMLSDKIHSLFVALASKDVHSTPGGHESKTRISTGTKRLRKGLNALAPFSAPIVLIFLFIFTAACGLKTGLKIDAEDLRPSIPFRPIPKDNAQEGVKVQPPAAKPAATGGTNLGK